MLASAVGAGMLVGLASGGSFRNLSRIQVTMVPIFVAGIVLRLLTVFPIGSDAQKASYVLSMCLLTVVSLANLRLFGAPIVTLGLTLNTFVIATSAGVMPVASQAILAAGTMPPTDALHLVSENVSHLADVIPVGLLGVYSIGDVILAIGTATLIVSAMRTSK